MVIKYWLQDIANEEIVLVCSQWLFSYCWLILTFIFVVLFVFNSYSYQLLWPYWELVFEKEMQYNSNTILDEFKYNQYNTIQFLNCLKVQQFNTIQAPLYCISIQFTLYWSTLSVTLIGILNSGICECSQVIATNWIPSSECTQVNALKWMHSSECTQVNALKWLHSSECTQENALK
jgi:hypothetical protein